VRRQLRILVTFTVGVLSTTAADPLAWKNGGESTARVVKFGTHDYIAKAYPRAGTPSWLRPHLTAYFLGTEAPDVGPKIAGVTGSYRDTAACHCILFAANGDITNNRAESRVRKEYDKAQAVFRAGEFRRAAFYAGARAHYLGDLSQFMHVMGADSHWGAEDQRLHAAYEVQIEQSIAFRTRSSAVLDPFLTTRRVRGTPAEVTHAVARFTEQGEDDRTPGWMYRRWQELRNARQTDPSRWDRPFPEQTSANVDQANRWNCGATGAGRCSMTITRPQSRTLAHRMPA
jgi:hypothetical protein